ncbi:MAG: hypothetical protein AAFO89_03645 [Planctomycetota bacterium]
MIVKPVIVLFGALCMHAAAVSVLAHCPTQVPQSERSGAIVGSIALGIESLGGPARGGPFAVAGVLLIARRRHAASVRNETRPA